MPAIGPHKTATSDGPWDGPEAKANLRNDGTAEYYRSAYAWVDSQGDKTKKAAYKFIHHEVSADGTVGAANLTACSTGIGVLNGGRGGTVIPAGDRKGVYAHLAKHITDAGKEAPDLEGEGDNDSDEEKEALKSVDAGDRVVPLAEEKFPAVAPAVYKPHRALREFHSKIWAIEENKYYMIEDLLVLHAGGCRASETLMTEWHARTQGRSENGGAVAVVPIFGTIASRVSMLSDASGGMSADRISAMLDEALADSSVRAVVLDVDSPGGTVYGIDELSSKIYSARRVKPIYAMVNPVAASAAYWLATAAKEVSVMPSGEVGSVGVFAAHTEESAAAERFGIKTTLISAGKYKTEGNPYEPLNDEARAAMQSRVNEYYGMFISALARNRGVTQSDVKENFGEGRMMGAKTAMRMGMVDRIETMGELLNRIGAGSVKMPMRMRSEDEGLSIDARERRLRLLAG